MKLTVIKRIKEESLTEIKLPYYYKIVSKGVTAFGCVTKDHHYIVRKVAGQEMYRYEAETVFLQGQPVEINTASFDTFSDSYKSEFSAALAEFNLVAKKMADAIDIER